MPLEEFPKQNGKLEMKSKLEPALDQGNMRISLQNVNLASSKSE